jgi:hypothetical protein
VEKIHAGILSEDNKGILTKGLAATYKVEQAPLTDEELIRVCHDGRAGGHLESRGPRTSYEEGAISATLGIESPSTSPDAIHAAGTRSREIKDMTE